MALEPEYIKPPDPMCRPIVPSAQSGEAFDGRTLQAVRFTREDGGVCLLFEDGPILTGIPVLTRAGTPEIVWTYQALTGKGA